MNLYKSIFAALLISIFAACSPSTQPTESSVSGAALKESDTALFARMSVIEAGPESTATMKFTVYNPTDSVKTFCKWHTPFEPLMSKYLDVTSTGGAEAAYKGPMAKRVMPPPADSYISIKAKDSLSVNIDLATAYDLKTGSYSVKYNSSGISGINVPDSVMLVVK